MKGDIHFLNYILRSYELRNRTRPWWAPIGEQRFIDLVESGFYSECRFFRVVPNFVVQIGINGKHQLSVIFSYILHTDTKYDFQVIRIFKDGGEASHSLTTPSSTPMQGELEVFRK